MENELILKVVDVEKSFPGTKALNGVSLDVKRGEIHALVGENGAGKSTLMNIISGVFPADGGKVYLKGKEVRFTGPLDAQEQGVGFVHQELALCPHVTVAQNIFMGRLPAKNGMVNVDTLNRETQRILDLFHADFKPQDRLSKLSVAQQQVVEIARALSLNCSVVIFDEPTSSLNEAEAKDLFKVIEDIGSKGIGVLYISHKLSEIFEICDTITVMRDGSIINTHAMGDCTPELIVTEMVGKELGHLYPPKSEIRTNEVIMKATGYTRHPDFVDASFELKKGEILGLSGLVGSGRTELVRALCGLDECQKGELELNGKKIKVDSYETAIKNGLCYLTEDRKLDGLFLTMSITNNISASLLDIISKHNIIPKKEIGEIAEEYQGKLNIKTPGLQQKVENLSGGNQQKVMIAKLLATNPHIIIMDEPTRGIDVGAKSEIHNMLRDLCDAGIGVIVISSELPEIVGVCDRVVIMHEGRVVGELDAEEVTQKNIIQKTSQFGGEQGENVDGAYYE